MQASENPTLESLEPDPTLFVTAFKKNRFYLFTRRDPDDSKTPGMERDIFNEKPSKEDMIAATDAIGIGLDQDVRWTDYDVDFCLINREPTNLRYGRVAYDRGRYPPPTV